MRYRTFASFCSTLSFFLHCHGRSIPGVVSLPISRKLVTVLPPDARYIPNTTLVDPTASSTPRLTIFEIDSLCTSPSFELTLDNWWRSGANGFLKTYISEHQNTPHFLHHGLLNSLAKEFLHDPTIACGLNTPHRCSVPCADIVRKSPDITTARILYFVFTQAQHVSEVLRTIHDGLLAAQTTVGQMAEGMGNDFYYRGKGQDIWLKSMSFLLNKLAALFAELFPMKPSGVQIRKVLREQILAEYEVLARAESGERLTRMQAKKDSKIRIGLLEKSLIELKLVADEYGFLKGMEGVRLLMGYWKDRLERDVLKHMGGDNRGQKENAMFIVEFVRTSTTATRKALREVSMEMFSGNLNLSTEGQTIFQTVVFMGNFLPSGTGGDIGFYHAADMEQKITRIVMLKSLNAIWRSQKIYITCTKDFRRTRKPHRPIVENRAKAPNCRRDNTGPAEFKFCVEDYVCYMYKWSDRGPKPAWHNEEIPGKEILEEEPWSLDMKDVITSSVQAYLTGIRASNPSSISNTLSRPYTFSAQNFTTSFLPSTPGMFTLPVCFSTHNWATVITGHMFPLNALHNITPRNPIKSIPCNCGSWGTDTAQVWNDLGISRPYHGFWNLSVDKCGYQIYDRIKDTVERFVAYCQVDVRTTLAGRVRWQGRSGDCKVVIAAVKQLGTPEKLRRKLPEVHRALECRTNQAEWWKRRGCDRYKRGTLGSVLRILGVEAGNNSEIEGIPGLAIN